MTAIAPTISNHRKYRLPCLVMLPSLSLPPVVCCFGTNPIQAARQRPDENVFQSPISATNAVPLPGPMPGISASRRLAPHPRCRAMMLLSMDAISVPITTTQPTPQDNQLMSKHRVLSFKPQLRLEWRGQDGQNETEQPDHSASLGDSITSSTQIRFGTHTSRSEIESFDRSRGRRNHLHKYIRSCHRQRTALSATDKRRAICCGIELCTRGMSG